MTRKYPISKKKILRCYIGIPPKKGGMENHIKTLTEHQRILGFDVDIAFNDGERTNKNDILIFKGIRLSSILISPLNFIVFYIFLAMKLILKQKKYDIIHIHGDWSSFMFGPLVRRITNATRTYFSFHGKIHSNFVHSKIMPFIIKKICNRIFVTGYESYLLLAHTKKAIFQPSGVKDLFFEQHKIAVKDKIKIVTVTFLRPQKNITTFLNVAKLLPNCNFQIIGDGPEGTRLKEYAKLNEISNVEFLGNKSSEDVKEVLDNSDIFLFTSKEEGTPTAVMEAMACGLPIVTSNAGGTESIVKDHENGFVIYDDYENHLNYLNMIKILISDPNLIEKIKSNNIEKAKLFKWNVVAQRISSEMLY